MQPVQEGEAIQVGRACESDGRACAQLLRPYAPAAGGRWRRRGRSGNQGAGRQVRCRGKRHGGRQTPAARSGVSGGTPCRLFHGQRGPWQSVRASGVPHKI